MTKIKKIFGYFGIASLVSILFYFAIVNAETTVSEDNTGQGAYQNYGSGAGGYLSGTPSLQRHDGYTVKLVDDDGNVVGEKFYESQSGNPADGNGTYNYDTEKFTDNLVDEGNGYKNLQDFFTETGNGDLFDSSDVKNYHIEIDSVFNVCSSYSPVSGVGNCSQMTLDDYAQMCAAGANCPENTRLFGGNVCDRQSNYEGGHGYSGDGCGACSGGGVSWSSYASDKDCTSGLANLDNLGGDPDVPDDSGEPEVTPHDGEACATGSCSSSTPEEKSATITECSGSRTLETDVEFCEDVGDARVRGTADELLSSCESNHGGLEVKNCPSYGTLTFTGHCSIDPADTSVNGTIHVSETVVSNGGPNGAYIAAGNGFTPTYSLSDSLSWNLSSYDGSICANVNYEFSWTCKYQTTCSYYNYCKSKDADGNCVAGYDYYACDKTISGSPVPGTYGSVTSDVPYSEVQSKVEASIGLGGSSGVSGDNVTIQGESNGSNPPLSNSLGTFSDGKSNSSGSKANSTSWSMGTTGLNADGSMNTNGGVASGGGRYYISNPYSGSSYSWNISSGGNVASFQYFDISVNATCSVNVYNDWIDKGKKKYIFKPIDESNPFPNSSSSSSSLNESWIRTLNYRNGTSKSIECNILKATDPNDECYAEGAAVSLNESNEKMNLPDEWKLYLSRFGSFERINKSFDASFLDYETKSLSKTDIKSISGISSKYSTLDDVNIPDGTIKNGINSYFSGSEGAKYVGAHCDVGTFNWDCDGGDSGRNPK